MIIEMRKYDKESRTKSAFIKCKEGKIMAISGIGSNYNNVYGSTYASQKNEVAKEATKDTKNTTNDSVSDYYSYLQKNYDCVKNGSVEISGAYLKECAKNPEKAKELEKNLSFFKEGYEKGLKNAQANAKAMGMKLVNYSESWSIDNTGNVTMMASVTVTSDNGTKGWKELAEERAPRKRRRRRKQRKRNVWRRYRLQRSQCLLYQMRTTSLLTSRHNIYQIYIS